jgi:hypothetical protein
MNQDCLDHVIGFAACSFADVRSCRLVCRSYARAITTVMAERTEGGKTLTLNDASACRRSPTAWALMATALVTCAPTLSRVRLPNILACVDVDITVFDRKAAAALRHLASHSSQIMQLEVPIHDGFASFPVARGVADAVILDVVTKRGRSLTALDLSGSGGRVTSEAIAKIAMCCPLLEEIDLSNAGGEVTAACLDALAMHCPQLRTLTLRALVQTPTAATASQHALDGSLARIARRGNLERLDVSENHGLFSDASLDVVAAHCPRLRSLAAGGSMGRISDTSILAIAGQCPALTGLDLSFSASSATAKSSISDLSIVGIAAHCPMLQSLSVSGNRVTDTAIIAIAERCPRIQQLDVSHTKGGVTNIAIGAIARGCRELKTLNVGWSRSKISDQGLIQVLQNCPELQSLSVGGYVPLSDATRQEARQTHPTLKLIE